MKVLQYCKSIHSKIWGGDKTKYTGENFLNALEEGPQLKACIARKVGCGQQIARKYLNNLVALGKVKVSTLGGHGPYKLYSLAK